MKRIVICMTLLCAFLVFGCTRKHDDNLPAMLGLTPPPAPSNFVVTEVDDPLTPGPDYDLSWDIDDPGSIVSYFRVYVVTEFGSELQADSLSAQAFAATSLFPIPAFGVTAVTDENVESAMAVKAPQP